MIIATAGHVDHGKTLLVKALTGVDTDRLPEEKKRGMTIDLGFAYLPVEASETIGFIDVPGHERFVHNMLAGVAAIDYVLFIVAADDGPMPQTREHLAILDLLGMRNGTVALTKIDRVEADRSREVQREIAQLFSQTSLAGAPVLPVSATTGTGIPELKEHLKNAARQLRPRLTNGNFRLAIDRSFSIAGAGTIVTGTAVAGTVRSGDSIRILQAGFSARVRGIHAQNAGSEIGVAGQRCALNLSGPELKPKLITRGAWAVTGDVAAPVRKFDARVRVLASELHPLANWTAVHVHLGAADVTGHVAILDGPSIAPGATGLVQLVLDRPLGALYGDGLILRDQSAQRTMGGGRVIDIFPPARGRAKPERLAYLKEMETDDVERAFVSLLNGAPRGLHLIRFAQNRNLTARECAALVENARAHGAAGFAFSAEHSEKLKTAVVESLRLLHRRGASVIPNDQSVMLAAGIRVPREVASVLLGELRKEGIVVREATGLRLKTHVAQLTAADAAVWAKTELLLEQDPLRPPTVHQIADALALEPKAAEALLMRFARMGLLVRIKDNRFFRPDALQRYAQIIAEVASANQGSATAAQLRDRAGIGRVLAIEILEYFDRSKFTRRVGDAHQILRHERS